MRFCLLLLALLTPFLATPAAAQLRDPVPAGTRVRVWLAPQPDSVEGAAEPQRLRGTLLGFSSDSLTLALRPGVAPVTISWPAVKRLDESRGVLSRVESAARLGVLGAVEGMLEFVLLESISSERGFGSTGEAMLWGGAAGAGIGVVLGAWRPPELWRRIRLERR